jgi:ketosteroid isomerase-like protein
MSLSRDDVARWLDAYVEAWRSYDREAIGELFSEDCEYRYHPYDHPPVRGREEIAASWLDDRDEPDSWQATYEPVAVDGDVAVATGESTYTNPDGSLKTVYYNVFVMRFDDEGRCREFTEYFIERPDT